MDKEREKAYLKLSSCSVLEMIERGEISYFELLSRSRKDSVIKSIVLNKKLYEAVMEKIRILKQQGIPIRSFNDLIVKFLVGFVLSNIQEVPEEKKLVMNVIFNQPKVSIEEAYSIPYSIPYNIRVNSSRSRIEEAKALLKKAEAVRMAIIHETNYGKRLLLKDKLEELIGQALEKLEGDDSEQASRYRKLAKSILEGIHKYFEEEIE